MKPETNPEMKPETNRAGTVTQERVQAALARVLDPETHLSIVAMGLVYGVEVDDERRIKIQYTLTTPLCPLAGVIQERVRAELAAEFSDVPGFSVAPDRVVMELVFEPVWTLDRLSEEARADLGF